MTDYIVKDKRRTQAAPIVVTSAIQTHMLREHNEDVGATFHIFNLQGILKVVQKTFTLRRFLVKSSCYFKTTD